MTEFWVSQGNKWCDFCKIYISNNSSSIRTHELGTRHKDNVAKKLAGIKKDNAVKEKEKLLALKDLEKIEMRAKKSYERDVAAMRSLATAAEVPEIGKEGFRSEVSGTSRNSRAELLGDTRSKSSVIRLHEGALKVSSAAHRGSGCEPATQKLVQSAIPRAPRIDRGETESGRLAAQNVSSASRVGRSGKGMVASSLQVKKRNRAENSGSNSSEENAALAARESARKRIKEREDSLLGLYQSF